MTNKDDIIGRTLSFCTPVFFLCARSGVQVKLRARKIWHDESNLSRSDQFDISVNY